MSRITKDTWGRRERLLAGAIVALILAVIALVALVDSVHGAPASPTYTATINVPRGYTVHVYPEADASFDSFRWRCTTSRRWQSAIDGGWPVGRCRRIVVSGSVRFDVTVEPPDALLIVAWECLQTNTGRKYAEELCRQNSIDPEELDSIELEDEE